MIRPKWHYSGSKLGMYFAIADAIGAHPASVQNWDFEGCLALRMLGFLERSHMAGTLPKPTKPPQDFKERRRRYRLNSKPRTTPRHEQS